MEATRESMRAGSHFERALAMEPSREISLSETEWEERILTWSRWTDRLFKSITRQPSPSPVRDDWKTISQEAAWKTLAHWRGQEQFFSIFRWGWVSTIFRRFTRGSLAGR